MLFITFGHTNRDIWLCRYMPVRMEVVMAEKIVKNYMIILVIQILLTVVILFAASAIIWKCAGDEPKNRSAYYKVGLSVHSSPGINGREP